MTETGLRVTVDVLDITTYPHAMKGSSSGFGAIENGAWWNPGARQDRELAPEQPA